MSLLMVQRATRASSPRNSSATWQLSGPRCGLCPPATGVVGPSLAALLRDMALSPGGRPPGALISREQMVALTPRLRAPAAASRLPVAPICLWLKRLVNNFLGL